MGTLNPIGWMCCGFAANAIRRFIPKTRLCPILSPASGIRMNSKLVEKFINGATVPAVRAAQSNH
jgi:hypothetical protein